MDKFISINLVPAVSLQPPTQVNRLNGSSNRPLMAGGGGSFPMISSAWSPIKVEFSAVKDDNRIHR